MARTPRTQPARPGTARARPGPKRRGRPRREGEAADVRAKLLDVATGLFSERGFAEVGIREIARAARVTPGMIAYYFGDKNGLFEAMLDSVFERFLADVQALAATPQRGASAVEAFVHVYVHTVARSPWIPSFIVREVVTKDGPLRRRFLERYAPRGAQILPGLVAAEVGSGRLRGDLDPVLALLSLVGMCLFPFLVAPVLGPLLGFAADAGFAERLTAHTQRLFLEGARRQEGGS